MPKSPEDEKRRPGRPRKKQPPPDRDPSPVPEPVPRPSRQRRLPQTSATSFITLRISPSKHRELKESLERSGTVVPLVPKKSYTSTSSRRFITLRYQPAQDPHKFVAVQRDQDQDSAVDVATPAGLPDTSDQDPSHQFVGAVPGFDVQQSSTLAATKQDSKHHAGVDGGTEDIAQHEVSLLRRKVTQVPQEAAAAGSSREINARLQPASLGTPAFVTAATSFDGRDQIHGDGVISNTTPSEYIGRSHSTAISPTAAAPTKKTNITRLKLPPGWRLDESMQPVHDPNDVSGILKGVVDDLYDVQSKTHGFIPETQSLLIDKIGDISDKLARLKDVTDAQVTPNNPIHNVRIAPEIVDYVDEGRNPDIFTREFVENVQRGNAVINGKKQAFRDFSVILAQKMKEGIGGIDRQVDQIMQNAGLEKELAEAEKKAKDRKAADTDAKNGAK